MMADKNLRLLGLCKRGGMLVIGEEAIGKTVRATKKIKLIVLARDASDNTRKKIESHADAGNVRLIILSHDRETLGHAIGLTSCASVAVTDANMAKEIE